MADKLAGGIKAGSTSYSHTFKLISLADGSPVPGKIAADLTATYRRQGGTRQAISLTNLAAIDSAYGAGSGVGGGVKEDADGEYRLDLPDAMLATGADSVSLHVSCAGAYVFSERIPLETKGAAEVWTFLNTFAASVATAVWASANRTLTAFGFSFPSQWDEPVAGHGTAGTFGALTIDMGDPLSKAVPGAYGAGTAGAALGGLPAVKAATDKLDTALELSGGTYRFTSAALAQLLQLVVEGTVTVQQALRLANAANGGKVAGGAGTTVTIRDLADAKNRVSATVDQNGNRSAVTLDLS